MSMPVTLKGRCGKELEGKVWKQGGSVKCPDHWTVNTYPKPSITKLFEIVWDNCEGCGSINNGGVGSK